MIPFPYRMTKEGFTATNYLDLSPSDSLNDTIKANDQTLYCDQINTVDLTIVDKLYMYDTNKRDESVIYIETSQIPPNINIVGSVFKNDSGFDTRVIEIRWPSYHHDILQKDVVAFVVTTICKDLRCETDPGYVVTIDHTYRFRHISNPPSVIEVNLMIYMKSDDDAYGGQIFLSKTETPSGSGLLGSFFTDDNGDSLRLFKKSLNSSDQYDCWHVITTSNVTVNEVYKFRNVYSTHLEMYTLHRGRGS
jgi:hypothetical protein